MLVYAMKAPPLSILDIRVLANIPVPIQVVHTLHPRLSNSITRKLYIAFPHYLSNFVHRILSRFYQQRRISLKGCCIVTGIQINFHLAATPYL